MDRLALEHRSDRRKASEVFAVVQVTNRVSQRTGRQPRAQTHVSAMYYYSVSIVPSL